MNKTRISEQLIHKNPYWSIYKDQVNLPSGEEADYFRMHRVDGCLVIAENEKEEILVIDQYRYPPQRNFLEFPAGSTMQGKSPEESAKVELLEETGYSAQIWIKLGKYSPINGIMDNYSHIFYAKGLNKVSEDILEKLEKDDSHRYEQINDIKFLSIQEIERLIYDNQFDDGLCLAAFAMYSAYKKYKP